MKLAGGGREEERDQAEGWKFGGGTLSSFILIFLLWNLQS